MGQKDIAQLFSFGICVSQSVELSRLGEGKILILINAYHQLEEARLSFLERNKCENPSCST